MINKSKPAFEYENNNSRGAPNFIEFIFIDPHVMQWGK